MYSHASTNQLVGMQKPARHLPRLAPQPEKAQRENTKEEHRGQQGEDGVLEDKRKVSILCNQWAEPVVEGGGIVCHGEAKARSLSRASVSLVQTVMNDCTYWRMDERTEGAKDLAIFIYLGVLENASRGSLFSSVPSLYPCTLFPPSTYMYIVVTVAVGRWLAKAMGPTG